MIKFHLGCSFPKQIVFCIKFMLQKWYLKTLYHNANRPAEQPSPLSVSFIISLENHCKNIFVFCDFPTITYFPFHPGGSETINLPGLIAVALSSVSMFCRSCQPWCNQRWKQQLWEQSALGKITVTKPYFWTPRHRARISPNEEVPHLPTTAPQSYFNWSPASLVAVMVIWTKATLGSHLIFNTQLSVFASADGCAESSSFFMPLRKRSVCLKHESIFTFTQKHRNYHVVLNALSIYCSS